MLGRASRNGFVAAAIAVLGLGAAGAAQAAPSDRAPRFADYPVAKLSHMRVAKPVVPKDWGEDPRLRLQDTVGSDKRANFAGHYFLAVVGCGTACVWGAVVYPNSGRIVRLPSVSSWLDTHDKFEGIDFRHNSRLIVLSGARDEKKGDMGRHFYVLENGRLRFLKTIKSDGNFLELNK